MNTETLQVYESNKAMIDSQVATAKAYPRKIRSVIDNAVAIVTNSEEFANSCVYTIPRGNKRISGPSINMAKVIMQFYGNFRAEARVVEETAKHVVCEAVAFDLENNVAIKMQIKRLIVGKEGRYNEDMIVVTGNAGNAIALRNAVFAVVPKGIVDEVYNAALNKIAGDVKDENKLKAKRKIVVDALKERYNITEADILRAISKESIDHINRDDIITLVGIDTAIKEGDTTVDQSFRGKKKEEAVAKPREERLINSINNCANINQLESLKHNIKTNAERVAYDEKLASFKAKTKTNGNSSK